MGRAEMERKALRDMKVPGYQVGQVRTYNGCGEEAIIIAYFKSKVLAEDYIWYLAETYGHTYVVLDENDVLVSMAEGDE